MSINDKSITFGCNALPPIAWVEFAHEYPDQDQSSAPVPMADTNSMMQMLTDVNEIVNSALSPKLDADGWTIWPVHGEANCTDYVVTKRAELLKRGIQPSCLLIAEVKTPDNEPHAVLVVRTTGGDYVLDNRNPMIYLWNGVGYDWVRIQTPENPNIWKQVYVG